MLAQHFRADEVEIITPRADDAGEQAGADQFRHAQVGHVEVGRVDAREAFLPGLPRFVRAPRITRLHIGIQPRDDLDDGEPFGHAVGGQFAKVFGPANPP